MRTYIVSKLFLNNVVPNRIKTRLRYTNCGKNVFPMWVIVRIIIIVRCNSYKTKTIMRESRTRPPPRLGYNGLRKNAVRAKCNRRLRLGTLAACAHPALRRARVRVFILNVFSPSRCPRTRWRYGASSSSLFAG